MTTIIQIIIFALGVGMMWISGADGTWGSASALTYFGMGACLIGITLPFVVTLLEKIDEILKDLFE